MFDIDLDHPQFVIMSTDDPISTQGNGYVIDYGHG